MWRSLCAPEATFAGSYINALQEGYRLGDDPTYDTEAISAIAEGFDAHLARITQ